MKTIWIAYTDGYKSCYEEFGKTYAYKSDAISIKGIFDTELGCRRFCMETGDNYKCKEFNVRLAEEEECGDVCCEI